MNPSKLRRAVRAGVVLTGLAAVTAFGRGTDPLLDAALAGQAAFAPVTRFNVQARRVQVAATLPDRPGTPSLAEPAALTAELIGVVEKVCDAAGLDPERRRGTALVLAVHGDAALGRAPRERLAEHSGAALATTIADTCGLGTPVRAYTNACVAASTAVADAAAMIAGNRVDRVVVAAGYLVEPDQFALFDAGGALAGDGHARPFSAGRSGPLLGDGVAAVLLESATRHVGPVRARLTGWARTGDAYDVVAPRPDGAGLARAIGTALARGGIAPADLGYVNAHGSGAVRGDAAEAAALAAALGARVARIPVSSTKSVHGHALEASSLIELIVTVLAMERGQLPVNAGYLGPDEQCRLHLVLRAAEPAQSRYALSLNAAFGGANTALLIESPW